MYFDCILKHSIHGHYRYFTIKRLKHTKTWKIFPSEKKLVSQGGNKFKKRGRIQNFSIVTLNTEILQAIYQQKFKNTQKHGKYSL